MKTLSVLLLTLIVFAYCGGKAEKETPAASTDTTTTSTVAAIDTSDYLPVAHFLNHDMRNVESNGAGILLKRKGGDAKDSSYVQYKDFQLLVGQFFLKELDSTYFRNNFEETSLMDETTKMLNFIYTAKDTASQLQKVIVYIAPSLTSDKIDRIYMETSSVKDRVLIDKKLTWKIGKYCYSLTNRQPTSGDPTTTIERLIWDPEHYGDN